MGFIQTIKYCFQNYRNIKGRAPRSEFWYFTGFLFLIALTAIPLYFLINGIYILLTSEKTENISHTTIMLLGICQILLLIPFFSAFIRRLHDTNFPAWVAFPVFIIFVLGSQVSIPITLLNIGTILHTVYAQAGLIISQILTIGSIGLLCLPGTRGDNKFGPEPTIISNKPENIEIGLLSPIKTMTYLLKSNTKHERITIRHFLKSIFLMNVTSAVIFSIIYTITLFLTMYYFTKLEPLNRYTLPRDSLFNVLIIFGLFMLVINSISSMCIFGPRTMDMLKSRFRDANLNDKYFLVPIIAGYILTYFETLLRPIISKDILDPIIGISCLLPLIAYCIPGTKGPNRYGPDPRQPAPAETE